ncbi:unnamed protein product, partial [Polarella glacialis]
MSGQAEMDAAKVLEQCISGEVTEANALPQLLHLHRSNSKAVVAALSEKANAVVQQADAGAAATRAGSFLITVATFLDRENFKAAAADPRPSGNSKGAQKSKVSAPVEEVCRPLLDHILLLSGGKNRAAKDKVVRAQGCNLVAALAAAVPEHRSAEEKLVEFALDKVPSIREKAVRGLSGLLAGRSPSAEMALIARTRDQNTAVRASAVRGLRVSSSTAATLLERIDDIEACVRAQLFMRLADQPTTIEEFGPAAVARLVAGLVDRSSSVRGAAGQAVDAWTQHLGGSLNLLSRCDVTSDEALGEAAAAALAARFPEEGARVARLWLGQVTGKANAGTLPDGPAPVLLARLALASMGDEARDEVLDVPSLLQRTHAALEAASNPTSSPWQEYLLRQLLNVVALVDMCDEGLRRQVERLGEAVLFQAPPQKAAVAEVGTPAATSRMAQSAIDLGIVILRKCNGLARFQAQSAKHQAVESRCSTRIVLLVSEICKPFETAAADDDGEGDQSFTTRLSLQIQELNQATETRQQTKDNIASAMKKALKSEDYIQAQKLKEQSRKNEKELEGLISERSRLSEQRDGVCMRVLAIVTALLRWSNSDLRKDPALLGTLDQILLPLVSLPALSKEVEVAVVYSICLFCVRDGGVARSHWSLLLTLLRGLQAVEGQAKSSPEGAARVLCDTARAAVAARALADCARLHGGVLDRDEVLSAATALAAVPFSSRQAVHVARNSIFVRGREACRVVYNCPIVPIGQRCVLQAVSDLYAPQAAAGAGVNRRSADSFLSEFQRSEAVVPIAFGLLAGHAAGTQPLPPEAVLLLASSVRRRLQRSIPLGAPPPEEALRLASLLLQSAESGVRGRAQTQAAELVVRAAVTQWLHRGTPLPLEALISELGLSEALGAELLLETLSAFPEEANTREVRIDMTRAEVLMDLSSAAPRVMAALSSKAQQPNVSARKCLTAATNWLGVCEARADLLDGFLAASPLLSLAASQLQNGVGKVDSG